VLWRIPEPAVLPHGELPADCPLKTSNLKAFHTEYSKI